MNNLAVRDWLDECNADLLTVLNLVALLGYGNYVVPYLNKYALIRACGAIETAYKSLVADHCSKSSKKEVQNFIDSQVRDRSRNPSYDAVIQMLKAFSGTWSDQYKARISALPTSAAIISSHKSLVEARNDFAHGGNPSTTVQDVIDYFLHCRVAVEILDDIIG